MNSLFFVFFSIFFLICSLFVERRNNNKVFFYLVGIVLAFLIANRDIYNVPDTIVYVDVYKDIQSFYPDNLVFEYGFSALTYYLYKVSNGDVLFYLLVIILINIFFIRRSLNNFGFYKYSAIGLILYFAYFGLFYNAIVIRQGISVSIVVYAFSILYRQHLLGERVPIFNVVILLLLALSFHNTALIGVSSLLAFYKLKGYSRNGYTYIFLLSIISYVTKIGVFLVGGISTFFMFFLSLVSKTSFAKFFTYTSLLDKIELSFSFRILFFIITLFFILLSDLNKLTETDKKLYSVYFYGVFFICLFGFFDQISRILDYMLIFSFVIMFKLFLNIRSFDTRLIFLFFVILVQEFFAFRLINGV